MFFILSTVLIEYIETISDVTPQKCYNNLKKNQNTFLIEIQKLSQEFRKDGKFEEIQKIIPNFVCSMRT